MITDKRDLTVETSHMLMLKSGYSIVLPDQPSPWGEDLTHSYLCTLTKITKDNLILLLDVFLMACFLPSPNILSPYAV